MPAFKTAGVTPPKTWAQLITAAKTLKASGTPAYSIGGADGWTLTDLFENIYLRQAGAAKYNALSAHKIKWTDPSVTTALKTMAQIVGDSANIAGGTIGRGAERLPDSVTNVFPTPAEGGDGVRGRLRPRRIASSTKAKPRTGFNGVPVPVDHGRRRPGAVEIGGDTIVTFRDTPAIEAFVKFLATAPAADGVGEARRLRDRQQEHAGERLPGRDHPGDRGGDRQGEDRRVRHVRPAAGVVRRHDRPGRVGDLPELPAGTRRTSAGIQKKLESAATAAYKKGK